MLFITYFQRFDIDIIVNTHRILNLSYYQVRTTKHNGRRGHSHSKVSPSSPPRDSTDTPPTSPESEAESPSRSIKLALIVPPPPLHTRRESPRKTGERKRMVGAIPAGPNYVPRSLPRGRGSRRQSEGPDETASDDGNHSHGSHTTRTEKRSNVRRRSKSMMPRLDHLRI